MSEKSPDPDKTHPEGEDEPCRWGPCCQPSAFQKFRDSKCLLFWLCWAVFFQGFIVNGLINIVISTLERRFDLSSKESGLIASCYDILSTLSVLPIAYFGGIGHKSRYLASGMLILGNAAIVFAIPHFTTDNYRSEGSGTPPMCDGNDTSTCGTGAAESSLSDYKYVFYFCSLAMGLGSAPLLTLGPVFLDASVSVRHSSLYEGIYFAFATLGPAIGFVVGGVFLNLYVDFDSVKSTSIAIPNPNSSQFVGAWWIGFIFAGVFCILSSFFLFGFPNILPGSSKYKEERKKEVYGGGSGSSAMAFKRLSLRDVLLSLKYLFTNPMFMFLTLAEATEGLLISGLTAFTPKFIELQFGIPSSTSALYTGLLGVPMAGGGTFLGGYIVKRFNMRVRAILKYCLGFITISLLSALYLLIICDQISLAGINTAYGSSNQTTIKFDGTFKPDVCHNSCGCSQDEAFEPVCGRDGITYFSPCYAGCESLNIKENPWQYQNCSCVGEGPQVYSALGNQCRGDCGTSLPLFLTVFAVFMLSSFMVAIPAFTCFLRIIEEQQRAFALGVQWTISKCLGSIPGAIVFGALTDSTCLLWQSKCGQQGSCYYYDNKKMSYYFVAVTLAAKVLTTTFFIICLCIYKPPKDERTPNKVDMEIDITAVNKDSNKEIHVNPGYTNEGAESVRL